MTQNQTVDQDVTRQAAQLLHTCAGAARKNNGVDRVRQSSAQMLAFMRMSVPGEEWQWSFTCFPKHSSAPLSSGKQGLMGKCVLPFPNPCLVETTGHLGCVFERCFGTFGGYCFHLGATKILFVIPFSEPASQENQLDFQHQREQ